MQANQSLALTLVAASPAMIAGYFLARRGRGMAEVVAAVGSVSLLGLVFATGLSLIFASGIHFLLLLLIAPAISGVLALALHRGLAADSCQPNSPYGTQVVLVAILVSALSFGRQFEYASFWGDVGVYLRAMQHFASGGAVEFDVATMFYDVANQGVAPAPLNGMNSTESGHYQFHALPVWPAFASLWGDQAGVTSILLGLALVQFHQIAVRLSGSSGSAYAATLVLATLPIAWHQAIYPTAEILLLGMGLGTLLLVCISGSFRPIVVLVGVLSYGFVHVGLILLAPLIGLVIAAFGIETARRLDRSLPISAAAATLACLGAIGFGQIVSEKYVHDIIAALFGGRQWLAVAVALTPLAGALPWLGSKIPAVERSRNALIGVMSGRRGAILMLLLVAGMLVTFAIQAYLLGWTDYFMPETWSKYSSWSSRVSYVDKGIYSLPHLAVANAALATAVIGMAAFIALPARWARGAVTPSWPVIVLWVAAAYCVFVFCVIRVDLTNNYYASRYFLPNLIPLLLLLAAYWIAPRWKAFVPFLVLAGIANVYFVSALLGAGFYKGDKWLTETWLRNAVPGDSELYFHGSDWLRYMAASRLYATNMVATLERPSTGAKPPLLLTDFEVVVGGQSDCVSYPQQSMPWQIGYPVNPSVELHKICVVRPDGVGEFRYLGPRWMEQGELSFLIASPGNGVAQEVTIGSLGWWSGKRPFKDALASIEAELIVCDETIKPILIEPKRIVFRIRLSQPFCFAKFRTATFVPAEIGEGSDRRSLGMDVLHIRADLVP